MLGRAGVLKVYGETRSVKPLYLSRCVHGVSGSRREITNITNKVNNDHVAIARGFGGYLSLVLQVSGLPSSSIINSMTNLSLINNAVCT